MTPLQCSARVIRWICDGIALLFGVAAFVNLVGGEGTLGWEFLGIAAGIFVIGQVIRLSVKGSVAPIKKARVGSPRK